MNEILNLEIIDKAKNLIEDISEDVLSQEIFDTEIKISFDNLKSILMDENNGYISYDYILKVIKLSSELLNGINNHIEKHGFDPSEIPQSWAILKDELSYPLLNLKNFNNKKRNEKIKNEMFESLLKNTTNI